MAIIPINISRVSNLLSSSIADQAITTTQAQLVQVQNELSTGLQVTQPSDNPSASALILSLNKTLSQQTGYGNNITAANSQLGTVSNTLTSLSDLLLQAQDIASKDVGSSANSQEQQGDATVINSLLSQVQSLANTQSSNGVYIFGGDKGNTPPYVSANGGVQFVGSSTVPQTLIDDGVLAPTTVSGPSVFGGVSSRVSGADLDPAVTDQTQLSDLTGANNDGVQLGDIQLSNGSTSATIDLSQAQTLGDVVNDINSAAVGGITASLSTTGINLTGGGGDNITVTDPSGTTASDLGIATAPGGAGGGVPVTGNALNPKVTLLTPLSTLVGGAGLDPSGIILSNGITTKTVTFPPAGDIQSVLNAINGSGLGVSAQINSAGTGINVQNTTQGTTLTIGENGGQTATQLGIRSFSPNSPLSELNDGTGVSNVPAGTANGDFKITDSNGTGFYVSVAGAVTVEDVINDINTAATTAGAGVTASFATTGNGIVLTDTAGRPSGTLTLQSENGSTAAADLGLTVPASGTTITGADVNGIQAPGIFGDLSALSQALTNGDSAGITAAAQNIQNDYNAASDAGGLVGAQQGALQDRTDQITSQSTATTQLLSSVQDVNMTSAISEFQTLQTALQAALLTTAQSQQLSLLNFLS